MVGLYSAVNWPKDGNLQLTTFLDHKSKVPLVIKREWKGRRHSVLPLRPPHTGSWTLFQLLPSGCSYRLPLAKTVKKKSSTSSAIDMTWNLFNVFFLGCMLCRVFICVAVFMLNCVFNLFIFLFYAHLWASYCRGQQSCFNLLRLELWRGLIFLLELSSLSRILTEDLSMRVVSAIRQGLQP